MRVVRYTNVKRFPDNPVVKEYNVEVWERGARWTVGRVFGSPGDWVAQGVGVLSPSRAWTTRRRTRAEAVADMLAGVTWLDLVP